MNVVIIRSNPVKPDSRVEKEAYSLINHGYNVKILCWDRDSDHDLRRETISVGNKRIPVFRLGFKAGFGQGFRNIIPFLKFQIAMTKWLKRNLNEYDVIHACDFDTAFFSNRISKKYNKKFIFDIFDFLGGDANTILKKIEIQLQRKLINNSDATIICTEERIHQIEGTKPKKLVVIHNTPSIVQMPKIELKNNNMNNNCIKVVYVGILQDFRLLIELSNYFKNNKHIELHIGGFGKYHNYFKMLGDEYENIHYYGRLKYEDTLALENNCDIMLAIYDPTLENHRYAAPNKFYEALMLGKPLIMAKGTGMSEVVAKNDLGEIIDYSEVGFAKGLEKLIERKNEWEKMSLKMREIYSQDYDWNEMEKRLIELYTNI
ncbi:MAG: glycosyltransferase family 4 protein [Clostridia bacterium]|nr:glycosyltransferase family 4 protein [Clostridia bacterium]